MQMIGEGAEAFIRQPASSGRVASAAAGLLQRQPVIAMQKIPKGGSPAGIGGVNEAGAVLASKTGRPASGKGIGPSTGRRHNVHHSRS
jgi:hypothetical protein